MNFDGLFGEEACNSNGDNSSSGGNNGNSNNVNSKINSSEDLINIQNIEDVYARYKMPKLQSRIKDKGKFAETFVSNLPELAKALKVNLPALIKHIDSTLGSQFMLADKKDLSSYYIKGRFSYEQLYEPVRSFIDQYVLCSKCGLPELNYVKDEKKKDSEKCSKVCKSCGNSVRIDAKDRIYKLLL